jgi:hypothetical protein
MESAPQPRFSLGAFQASVNLDGSFEEARSQDPTLILTATAYNAALEESDKLDETQVYDYRGLNVESEAAEDVPTAALAEVAKSEIGETVELDYSHLPLAEQQDQPSETHPDSVLPEDAANEVVAESAASNDVVPVKEEEPSLVDESLVVADGDFNESFDELDVDIPAEAGITEFSFNEESFDDTDVVDAPVTKQLTHIVESVANEEYEVDNDADTAQTAVAEVDLEQPSEPAAAAAAAVTDAVAETVEDAQPTESDDIIENTFEEKVRCSRFCLAPVPR